MSAEPLDPKKIAAGMRVDPASIPVNGSGPHGDKEKQPQFQLIHADELDKLPPIRWLIKGQIPERGFTVLYGPSGSGKSFVALDFALRIAQTHTVVYIAAEGAEGYAARKLVWCKHHKQPAGKLYFIPRSITMLDPHMVTELVDAILPIQPSLVIIDTLHRTMIGGDENSARDMGLFVSACDALRNMTGCAVLVVHHTNAAGARERGSSALRAASDQMLEISQDDDVIKVSCDKSKDAKEFEPYFRRRLIIQTDRITDDGSPETSCVLVEADRVITTGVITNNMRKILEALALETFRTAGGKAKDIYEYCKMDRQQFYRAMSRLIAGGYVRQHAKGDPYFIEEDGLAVIH